MTDARPIECDRCSTPMRGDWDSTECERCGWECNPLLTPDMLPNGTVLRFHPSGLAVAVNHCPCNK